MRPDEYNNGQQPQNIPQQPVMPPGSQIPPVPPYQASVALPQQPYVAPSPMSTPGMQPPASPAQPYAPPFQQQQPVPVASSPYASVDQSVFRKRRSLAKTLSVAVGVIIILVVIGVNIASFMATQRSVTLERYEGDGYSILVPKEYEKETDGDSVIWTSEKYTGENGKKDVASRMVVFVDRSGSPADVQELIEGYDSGQQEFLKSMTDGVVSANDGANITLRDVETKKDDHRGLPARSVTAKIYNGDKMTAMIYTRTIFTEKGVYVVIVVPHQQVESGFRESAQKILDSFEVK